MENKIQKQYSVMSFLNLCHFQGVHEARESKNSSLVGTGITPEGINQNSVIYDLMNEMGWQKHPTNLSEW